MGPAVEGRSCWRLGGGEALWVAGPARVEVAEGCVLVSGIPRCSGDAVVVPATRGASFAPEQGSARLCASLGSGAAAAVVKWDPAPWIRVVDRLEREAAERIVVIGPGESGKSTLSTWIANRLGLGFVEADVGQNELGLPGCVAYSRPPGEGAPAPWAMEPLGCFFVGHVSSGRVPELVVAAAARAARRQGRYVIDTDGYVEDRGVFYKRALVEAVGADAAVVMGGGAVLRQAAAAPLVLDAPPPPLPRERSRLDRRSFRSQVWSRLFSGSQARVLRGVEVLGLCGFSAGGEGVVYECPGGRVYVQPRPPRAPGAWLRPGWERGLVAALLGGGSDAPVLVERIDPVEGVVVARVPRLPWSVESRGPVRLGWVRLSENYREEHLRPGLLPGVLVSASSRYRR